MGRYLPGSKGFRQMSENHPLTDLCLSTSVTPSAPIPTHILLVGEESLGGQVHQVLSSTGRAKMLADSAVAPGRPSLLLLTNPELFSLSLLCLSGLFSTQDLERLGIPGFWNKIKRSLLQRLLKNSSEETWLAGRKTRTCLPENHSCVIFFFHWLLPDYRWGSRPRSQPSVSRAGSVERARFFPTKGNTFGDA